MKCFSLIVSMLFCYQLLSRMPLSSENYDNSQLIKLTKNNTILESLPIRSLAKDLIRELELEKSASLVDNEIYTKFSDIKRFNFIPPHYAFGYDENETLAAIFDLSYQNIQSMEFKGRSSLGFIALDDIQFDNIIDVLKSYLNKAKAELTSADDNNRFFDGRRIEQALDYLLQNYGFKKSALHSSFLDRLPLRSSANKNNIRLTDIDFERIMSPQQYEEFQKAILNIESNIEEIFELEAVNLLSEIGVVKNEKHYELLLMPANSYGTNEEPMKVIDFRQENPSRRDLVALWLKTNISDLAALIPHPEVAALIQLSLQRYLRFHESQLSFHRWRAYEYIVAAEKNDTSPFYFLSDDERDQAAHYILSRESSIFKQLIDDEEIDFLANLEQEQTIAAENRQWTQKNSVDLRSFADDFAFAHKNSKDFADAILGLADHIAYKKQPFTMINYLDADDIYRKRQFLYHMVDALNTIILPLPHANLLLMALYDILVMDTTRQASAWEARLASYLHSEEDDVIEELEVLYRQRCNPLELSLADEEEFIYRSRQFLGLIDGE